LIGGNVDSVFEKDKARVVVDSVSLPLLKGAHVDYVEELIGSSFRVVDNPQAASTCGCDVSFEVK
jgi:iron-sulfur cluster assembly accessory protein